MERQLGREGVGPGVQSSWRAREVTIYLFRPGLVSQEKFRVTGTQGVGRTQDVGRWEADGEGGASVGSWVLDT